MILNSPCDLEPGDYYCLNNNSYKRCITTQSQDHPSTNVRDNKKARRPFETEGKEGSSRNCRI